MERLGKGGGDSAAEMGCQKQHALPCFTRLFFFIIEMLQLQLTWKNRQPSTNAIHYGSIQELCNTLLLWHAKISANWVKAIQHMEEDSGRQLIALTPFRGLTYTCHSVVKSSWVVSSSSWKIWGKRTGSEYFQMRILEWQSIRHPLSIQAASEASYFPRLSS